MSAANDADIALLRRFRDKAKRAGIAHPWNDAEVEALFVCIDRIEQGAAQRALLEGPPLPPKVVEALAKAAEHEAMADKRGEWLAEWCEWARDLLDDVGEPRPDGKGAADSREAWGAVGLRKHIAKRVAEGKRLREAIERELATFTAPHDASSGSMWHLANCIRAALKGGEP